MSSARVGIDYTAAGDYPLPMFWKSLLVLAFGCLPLFARGTLPPAPAGMCPINGESPRCASDAISFPTLMERNAWAADGSPMEEGMPTLNSALRVLLPLYLLLYGVTCVLWRSIVVWRRSGVYPITIGHSDNAHDFIGRLFLILTALLGLCVIVFAVAPPLFLYLGPLRFLEHEAVPILGLLLLAFSLVWTALAQAQMRDSWRVGLDPSAKTELVRRGLYRYSRNPIYLGLLSTVAGIFLCLPNAVTLAFLAVTFSLVPIQVRLEEEYLSQKHGVEFDEYRRAVRRWL